MVRSIVFLLFISLVLVSSCNRKSTGEQTQEKSLREKLTVIRPKGQECRVDSLTQFEYCEVNNVSLDKGNLAVKLAYSGGCENHCFQLTWNGQLNGEDKNRLILNLLHDDNNDKCEAYLHKTKLFELDSLKSAVLNEYEISKTTVVLQYGKKKAKGLVWRL